MANEKPRPRIKLLSDSEVEEIHERSLHLLETTGIGVDHPGGLEKLEQAGAQVDHEGRRAKLPRELVQDSLNTIPKSFLLAARDPEKDCPVELGGRPYSRNGGGADYTLDLESGKFRPLTVADMHDYIRLMDALEGISFIAPVFGHDMPTVGRDVLMLREMFSHTDKHIHLRTFSRESFQYMLDMAAIVAGGKETLRERPLVSLLEAPVSPLKFLDISVDAYDLCGEYGIPVDICVMPISGGTGPNTLAGNVLLFNTEFLGGAVIHQAYHPGAPLQYAPRPMVMDMSTGIGLVGTIETGIMSAAGAQMADFYQVPVSLHGPWTDSMLHDGQSTFERTYLTLMAALGGANVLVGAGMLQQSLAISHEQLVIDDEVNRTVFRVMEGLDVDEGLLGEEAIARVGPGGNFLADEHTIEYLRGYLYQPKLLYRRSREDWVEGGEKTFEQRAKDRARAILAEHEPTPLPPSIAEDVDALVEEALETLKD
jgi:trimethylamine--corrinoid protein Co-methyltransferase